MIPNENSLSFLFYFFILLLLLPLHPTLFLFFFLAQILFKKELFPPPLSLLHNLSQKAVAQQIVGKERSLFIFK